MTTFVALGPHIVDVLGRPVTHIPDGQGGALLTDMAVTVAGTAGGTAVDLARLGASVRSVGAVGADGLGRFLRGQLESVGVDTRSLIAVPGHPTSGTILPIRPNGERPALHLPGATAYLRVDDLGADVLQGVDYVHVGGPDVLGDFAGVELPALLARARAAGTVISADLLSTVEGLRLEQFETLFALVDHLLINDQQAANLTGESDAERAGAALRAAGPAHVVVSCGAAGGVLVDADGCWRFPALDVPVIDTTGCGDAFSAGYLYALSIGWTARRRCAMGTCCAALVAQALGSDGIPDLRTVEDLIAQRWDPLVDR